MPQSSKLFYYYILVSFFVGLSLGYGLSYFFPVSKLLPNLVRSESTGLVGLNPSIVDDNSTCNMWVEVAGAVNKPGVFCFTQGSIVNQALLIAGGLNRLAAKSYVSQRINLAKVLEGGEKIYFPFENDLKCEMVPYVPDISLDSYIDNKGRCISINTASKKDLDSLNGVGEITADKIIQGRPYSKIEELTSKEILNEKTFQSVRSSICL